MGKENRYSMDPEKVMNASGARSIIILLCLGCFCSDERKQIDNG